MVTFALTLLSFALLPVLITGGRVRARPHRHIHLSHGPSTDVSGNRSKFGATRNSTGPTVMNSNFSMYDVASERLGFAKDTAQPAVTIIQRQNRFLVKEPHASRIVEAGSELHLSQLGHQVPSGAVQILSSAWAKLKADGLEPSEHGVEDAVVAVIIGAVVFAALAAFFHPRTQSSLMKSFRPYKRLRLDLGVDEFPDICLKVSLLEAKYASVDSQSTQTSVRILALGSSQESSSTTRPQGKYFEDIFLMAKQSVCKLRVLLLDDKKRTLAYRTLELSADIMDKKGEEQWVKMKLGRGSTLTGDVELKVKFIAEVVANAQDELLLFDSVFKGVSQELRTLMQSKQKRAALQHGRLSQGGNQDRETELLMITCSGALQLKRQGIHAFSIRKPHRVEVYVHGVRDEAGYSFGIWESKDQFIEGASAMDTIRVLDLTAVHKNDDDHFTLSFYRPDGKKDSVLFVRTTRKVDLWVEALNMFAQKCRSLAGQTKAIQGSGTPRARQEPNSPRSRLGTETPRARQERAGSSSSNQSDSNV